MIYGPPEQSIDSAGSLNTSSNVIYELISGKTEKLPDTGLPLWVDVRDVAKAHILALEQDSVIGKRVILSGGPYDIYSVSISPSSLLGLL